MKKYLIFLAFSAQLISGHSQTWNKINPPSRTAAYCGCWFVTEDTGWVISDDSIFKTIDGGTNWIFQTHPKPTPGTSLYLQHVNFINSNDGVISCLNNQDSSGANTSQMTSLLWTNDGGNTWAYVGLDTSVGWDQDAKMASPTVAYAGGQYGVCGKTIDGGAGWTSCNFSPPNSKYTITRLFCINADTVYFAGLDNFMILGAFGRTTDGGATWTINTISSNPSMNSIWFYNYYKGWMVGYNGEIRYSIDGGLSWQYGNSGITTEISDVAFSDSLNGFAVTYDGRIIHSTDGGHNWSVQYNGTCILSSLSFTKPNGIGYAVGDSGLVLKYESNNGINNLDKAGAFIIFPNPSNGQFTIKSLVVSNQSSVEAYNVLGEKVYSQLSTFNSQLSIDLSNQPNGIYLYRVIANSGELIGEGKMIIQK